MHKIYIILKKNLDEKSAYNIYKRNISCTAKLEDSIRNPGFLFEQ